MEVCPGGVQPLLCHRHMVCTYSSTFPREAELVRVSAFEAEVVVSVTCECQSVRQLSHAFCDHRSGVLRCVDRALAQLNQLVCALCNGHSCFGNGPLRVAETDIPFPYLWLECVENHPVRAGHTENGTVFWDVVLGQLHFELIII